MAEITVFSIVMVLATTFMHSTVGKPTVRSINWHVQSKFLVDDFLSFTLCAETFKKMQETSPIACVLKLPRSQSAEALIPIEILIYVFFSHDSNLRRQTTCVAEVKAIASIPGTILLKPFFRWTQWLSVLWVFFLSKGRVAIPNRKNLGNVPSGL